MSSTVITYSYWISANSLLDSLLIFLKHILGLILRLALVCGFLFFFCLSSIYLARNFITLHFAFMDVFYFCFYTPRNIIRSSFFFTLICFYFAVICIILRNKECIYISFFRNEGFRLSTYQGNFHKDIFI